MVCVFKILKEPYRYLKCEKLAVYKLRRSSEVCGQFAARYNAYNAKQDLYNDFVWGLQPVCPLTELPLSTMWGWMAIGFTVK